MGEVTGAPAPKRRPDPRPMRLVLGAGALAGLSVMAAGLVRPPLQGAATDPTAADDRTLAVAGPDVRIVKRIHYVRLAPGEHAPPGAKVIREAAPTPRVVVTTVHARNPPVVHRVVVRSRQSGG